MGETRVTMRDVASRSGVSPSTVSFVMNDVSDQTISAETRERVLRAAHELGYRPNPLARALREGVSRIVLLKVGDVPRTPVLESFIVGIDEELAAADHGLLVSFSPSAGSRSREAALEAVRPRFVIDLPAMYADGASVDADGGWVDGMAAHYATQVGHLHAKGHQSIAVAVPADPDAFMIRMAGYVLSAAARLGMAPPTILAVATDGAVQLDSMDGGVTAVAALTDALALAVLAAAADAGRSVPEDLAVIGWGDSTEGALWRPRLTTVHVDARSYGRRLAREVLGMAPGSFAPASSRIVERHSV